MSKLSNATTLPVDDPVVAEKTGAGTYDAAGIIRALWSRMQPPNKMSRADLEFFSGSTDVAVSLARNVSAVTSGIACLISAAAHAPFGVVSSGALQDADSTPILLSHIADTVAMAAALMDIGADADCVLSQLDAAAIQTSQVDGSAARDSVGEIRE